MNFRRWAEDHGETDGFDAAPWACTDQYDQVAIVAAEEVEAAWGAWEDAACDEDPARREWAAVLTAIDRAALDIAAAHECQCNECDRARRTVAGYRAEAAEVAGEFGLPRPPAGGRIPRYPVNVGAIREKAERLVDAGAVWSLTDTTYIVSGDTASYYVFVDGPEPLDWKCACAWCQPQGESNRPGRGCAHSTAVHIWRAEQAAVAVAA